MTQNTIKHNTIFILLRPQTNKTFKKIMNEI